MSHPAGFFSYVRFNDETEEGRLSELRVKLEAEVAMLLGEKFELFQDTKGVGMGENWQKRLDEGLADSTVFIPILTPAYLKRPACRAELEKFLEKEKDLNRDDLVLPLLYLETPALTEEARRIQDPLAMALHAHQWRDWSDLRFEPWDKSKFLRLSAIAKEIVKTLERKPKASPRRPRTSKKADRSLPASAESGSEIIVPDAQVTTSTPEEHQARNKSKRIEPTTFVVDPMLGRGDFTSIGAAIAAANGGERILVRPHVYTEPVKLDKPVELIGDGKRAEIIIEASDSNAISFQTSFGRVANCTIRQMGTGERFAVHIPQGQLVLEDCDITSVNYVCVGVHGGANPILRRNEIHDAKYCGILVYDNGKGTFEDNDIFANALSGVEIKTGADPVLRRNRIHDGLENGVMAHEQGKGTLEDNDIFANALSGVEIRTAADLVVRRNRIHASKGAGVTVHKEGKGILEDNEIFANAFSGVIISSGGDPVLRRNRLHDGLENGVMAIDQAKGTLEDNDIFANALSGVEIRTAGDPIIRRNRLHDGLQNGVLVHKEGKETLENNEIFGNALAGVEIREGARPTIRQNRIHKNKGAGIRVHSGGSGILQNNDLRKNEGLAFHLDNAAADLIREGNIEA